MSPLLQRFITDQRGAITVMWAVLMPIIVGSMGLAIDTGHWYTQSRKLQVIADAAAISAAHSITTGVSQSTLQSVANTEATRNGFTAGNGASITVIYPPTSGAYSGDSDAVQVVVSQPQSRLFSMMTLSSDPTVTVRAVALKESSGGNGCVMTLSSSGSNAMNFNGNMNLSMSSCTLISNSTNTSSINLNGNITYSAYQLYSAGGIRSNGNIHPTVTEPNATYQDPVDDPYSGYTPDSTGSCDQSNYSLNGNFNTTLSPGTYCNGLSVNGNGTLNLDPGTYIIDRGTFSLNGNIDVTGTGVTIVLTSSTGSSHAGLTINGNAAVNISAPTTGPNAGMLIYKDRNASSSTLTFNGNADTRMQGVIYAPTQGLTFNGNFSSTATCTQLVSNTLTINGNVSLSSGCTGTGVTPISMGSSVRMAE